MIIDSETSMSKRPVHSSEDRQEDDTATLAVVELITQTTVHHPLAMHSVHPHLRLKARKCLMAEDNHGKSQRCKHQHGLKQLNVWYLSAQKHVLFGLLAHGHFQNLFQRRLQ